MEGASPLSPTSRERTALKEWAVLVDAMARGEILAMVRKGGIREQRAGFTLRHDRFLLYPTFFHEKSSDLAPRFVSALATSHQARPPAGIVRFSHLATVVAVWHVSTLDPLRAIDGEHGLSWSAVESRFRYRDIPGVQVVAVQVARLPLVAEVPEARRYGGCVSWVELDVDVAVDGAQPVLENIELGRRVDSLRRALGQPDPAP